jgi:hypothetical protein
MVGNERAPWIATFGTLNVFVDVSNDKFALESAHPINPFVGSLRNNIDPGEYELDEANDESCRFDPTCKDPPNCMIFEFAL